ncbi:MULTISPECIES: helix-turn-helix domain-containing protein [unclassified Pseudonocardia]|uniref:helix-turn-helix domain-containing protein n=1 Tax=unclassified Pseudonocardia TaxID=2619320 RepID=UPI000AC250CF|nr:MULTISPECIES: cupin domain-containing protein [unclassified Pseudonocardia]
MTGRREHLRFARGLRETGATPAATARQLRERFGVRALTAARLAHGWSQSDAAAEWNRRWPDAPRTFKAFSYWENWPGPTGHAPSLDVLERLARLYVCAVRDLLADLPDHGDAGGPDVDRAALVWQVQHLDLPELTRAVTRWGAALPQRDRRASLLRLSAAAAAAAPEAETGAGVPPLTPVGSPLGQRLCGIWHSRYSYKSTSRGLVDRHHHVIFRDDGAGRVEIVSIVDSNDSPIQLDLVYERQSLTGTWTEHTATDDHYRGARYHGAIQLVVDPTGRSARGRWVGYDRAGEVDSGPWEFTLLTTDAGPAAVREHARPAAPTEVTRPDEKGPSPGER